MGPADAECLGPEIPQLIQVYVDRRDHPSEAPNDVLIQLVPLSARPQCLVSAYGPFAETTLGKTYLHSVQAIPQFFITFVLNGKFLFRG